MWEFKFLLQTPIATSWSHTTMSSPTPLDDSQVNWRVDESMASHRAGDESNGLNEHHTAPGVDSSDYKRGGSSDVPPPSSMKGDGVFREKQVKVLRSFLSVACTVARSQSWSTWAS